MGAPSESLLGLRIARRSLDARRKGAIRRLRFVVHVDIELPAEFRSSALARGIRAGRITEVPPTADFHVTGKGPAGHRVVVIGSGPAGLFAALVLGMNGVRVDLVDRGGSLTDRARDLAGFHRTRQHNPESNLLFGEGGAGTYSDGKLYTRVDDPLEFPCLQTLVDHGAPEDIVFDSRAHIGTDRLHKLLPRLRKTLSDHGVRFHWRTRMDRLLLDPDTTRVRGVVTSAGEIPCDALFLAPGHSARDTLRSLHAQGLSMSSKPFQLGVRIEHPQEMINRGRFGDGPQAALLGAASYNLVCRSRDDQPSSHSFCMCPGGRIVASVNTEGELCTNGMSNSTHSSPFANAAVVTTFGPREFGDGPFAGVEFQERLERSFFEAGGGDYSAPAQHADDFVHGRMTKQLRRSSYRLGTVAARIDTLLPPRARDAIARALVDFDRKLPGYASAEGILVGLESRSSGPLRIPRDPELLTASGLDNLYPLGEGAGYAGGIMSAAIDGARAARTHLTRIRA